jgi:hypothetical protein
MRFLIAFVAFALFASPALALDQAIGVEGAGGSRAAVQAVGH